jgi:hypothetical protein
MPFIGDLLKHGSVSIVGVEKNTGKTECFNYIVRRFQVLGVVAGLTSIGVDGESRDQVTGTAKPEVTVFESMLFVTAESHFRQRRFLAEILDVSPHTTSLGRLVVARALETGKVLLSGPADTYTLSKVIVRLRSLGATIALVDGAVSRRSLGSPAVTDAMILTTGAALSAHLPTLVRKTKFVCDLIALPEVDSALRQKLLPHQAICAIDEQGVVTDLGIPSVFGIENSGTDIFRFGKTIFLPGALTDKMVNYLKAQKQVGEVKLVVRDFTKVFASAEVWSQFQRLGGSLQVLWRANLLAVCVNPTAPDGTVLDSAKMCDALSQTLDLPVWNVRQL